MKNCALNLKLGKKKAKGSEYKPVQNHEIKNEHVTNVTLSNVLQRSAMLNTQLSSSPDSQFVHYAHMQSLRDGDIYKAQQQIEDLLAQIKDSENTIDLLHMQDETLKKEIRELERTKKRDGANLEYLKKCYNQIYVNWRTRTRTAVTCFSKLITIFS